MMKQINYKEVAQNYSLRFYYLKKSYQLIILILLSITIGSCYTIVSDCEIPIEPGPLPAEPGIIITPNLLAFGDVTINSSNSQNITIQNSGTANLVILQATINGTGFTLSGVITPITIIAGGSRTITVQFLPTVIGPHSGSVILTHNATGSPDTVQLTGNGSSADGFWELTNAPPFVSSLAVANNGDIWAGTYSSEIFLSTDNGDRWIKKAEQGSIGYQLMSVSINQENGYIFASTHENGLYRSTDNGETWVKVTNNIALYGIVIAPSGELYVEGRGVYYSSDNGDTWVNKNNGLPYNQATSLALGADGTLYAGFTTGNYGIYRSTNGGNTWLPPINYADILVRHRAIIISDYGSIFAGTASHGILKSTDRGLSWDPVNTGLILNEGVMAMIYNPMTKDIFLGGGSHNSEVYRSTNLGGSWQLVNSGITDYQPIYNFAFNPNTGQMYIASGNGGVYRSRNYPE